MAKPPMELSELVIPRGRAGGVDPSAMVERQATAEEVVQAMKTATGSPQQSRQELSVQHEGAGEGTHAPTPMMVTPEQSLRVPTKNMQVKLALPTAQRLKILSAATDKTQQDWMELWITRGLDEAWRQMNNRSDRPDDD